MSVTSETTAPIRRFAWLWSLPAVLVAAGLWWDAPEAAALGLGLAAALALSTSI